MPIALSTLRRIVTPQDPEDSKRILEIACLAVASDGALAPEELVVLRTVNSELKAFTAADLEARIASALDDRSREDRVEQLRALASGLSNDAARQCAYKVSVVTALADLSAAEEEFEFDLDIQEALSLDPQTAEQLTSEVNELLMIPE